MPEPGQLSHLRQRRWLVEAVEEAPRLGEATLVHAACVDYHAQGEPVAVLWEHELCRISSIAVIANGGMSTSIVGKGSNKHDCRFAAEAVRDDLGLSVVTGHVGLFQRLHRANSELVCRRSNLAGHWARIG